MGRMDGRVAIVTGGASGIGAASVRRFVEEGASVVIADINDTAGEALAGELGDGVLYRHCDHTVVAENEATVAAATETFGKLDTLFNNAGAAFANNTFDSVDDDELARIVEINLIGPFRMTRAALPALRAAASERSAGAAIVFTSSMQGIVARPYVSPYTAAKHGIVGLMRGLALELGGRNVRVNALCPVATETPMLPQFMPPKVREGGMAEARERLIAGIPLRRMARAVDIANAALFLASDEAAMITGVALPVDGGVTAG